MADDTSLMLSEATLNITMDYLGSHGNKGYDERNTGFVHKVMAHASKADNEVSTQSIPGGAVPVSVVYGKKIPVIVLDGYFPYHYPGDFFDVFMPTLAAYRKPNYNTCKNIFLVGSILTVIYNGGGGFSELPIDSRWYVKKYEWKRSVVMKDRGGFTLTLWRWYRSEGV